MYINMNIFDHLFLAVHGRDRYFIYQVIDRS
jgi:hypothetical protein